MSDPIAVKLPPLPPAEVRKALDSVMGPVREAYDAAVAQAEAQVLDLLRDLQGVEPEAAALTLEVLEDARRRVEEGWVGNGAPHTIDEVARIVASDFEAQDGPWVAFPTPRVLDFRLGPWGACTRCGSPTRARHVEGHAIHLLCQADLEVEIDEEDYRRIERLDGGREFCPECNRQSWDVGEGRCMAPDCAAHRRSDWTFRRRANDVDGIRDAASLCDARRQTGAARPAQDRALPAPLTPEAPVPQHPPAMLGPHLGRAWSRPCA